jgi:hypothetical protein
MDPGKRYIRERQIEVSLYLKKFAQRRKGMHIGFWWESQKECD